MPLKMVWAADTAAPNGDTSLRGVGWYFRDWTETRPKDRSSRRHWEHTEDEVVRVRVSPVAEMVRARMLKARALEIRG